MMKMGRKWMGADLHKGVICFLCQSERTNYKIQRVMSVMSVKASFELAKKVHVYI